MDAFLIPSDSGCKEEAQYGGISAKVTFDEKMHKLNNHAWKESFSTGETCDRENNPTVAESTRSGRCVKKLEQKPAPLLVLPLCDGMVSYWPSRY